MRCIFCILLLLSVWDCGFAQSPEQTVVEGMVLDFYTKEPLPYATVLFLDTQEGATTSEDGRFIVRTGDQSKDKLSVSYLGYDTRTVQITPGIYQRATIELKPDENILAEIDVVAERRSRKDTAAHTLFRKVVRHKPENAPQEYDNYAYESYTKMTFGLYDISERLPSRVIIRKMPFVFDNTDTLESGITVMPGMIKETYRYIVYRKQPKKTKEILFADKFSGVDNKSISDLVDFNYEDVDPYGNTVNVNGKPIMSPFADNGLVNYKYFLTDTQDVGGYYCFKLEFTGRSAKDNAFSGSAWIHDATFAIRYIELSLLPQSNVNFINLFELEQRYDRVGGRYWFKDYESFQTNMNVFKKADRQSFMARKESWRQRIVINHPALDTLVEGDPRVIIDGARDQPEAFWKEVRMEPLTAKEANVYPTVDSVKQTGIYKFLDWFITALQTRYFGAGPIDIGQYDQIYSYNALEGPRVKLGLRTSSDLTERVQFNGYGAYGFDDDEWKYGGGMKLNLKRRNELWHQLGAGYRYDYSFVGQRERNDVHDNILNVILRSAPIDNIFLSEEISAYYEREWLPGFSTKFDFLRETYFSVPGSFDFDLEGNGERDFFITSEVGLELTYGKNLRYYESTSDFTRTPITTVMPRLTFSYRTGIKGWLNSDVGYHRLEANLTQRLLSPIGYTKYTIEAGKYFGKVPYPLLELHRGNESVYYEKLAYNLMNDFEYASDTWVAFWLEHHFDGFIMNKIPGIRYLQLRIVFYYKFLYGWLADKNEEILPLLDDMTGLNDDYHEIGVGLENILKLFRVDALFRLTQKGKPDIQKWGIRFVISPKF